MKGRVGVVRIKMSPGRIPSLSNSRRCTKRPLTVPLLTPATTEPPSHCSHPCVVHSGAVHVAAECWNSPIKCWRDKSNSEEFTPACSGSFDVSRGHIGPPIAPPRPTPFPGRGSLFWQRSLPLSGCTSPYFLFSYTQTTCLLRSNEKKQWAGNLRK